MIYCLQGTVLKKTLDMVVLSCAGVGYQMLVPASVASALPAVGQEATLFTEMHLTDNDVTLYGCASEEQKACFKLLTSVSGVGPKVGIAILNVLTPEKITLAISAADHKAFTAANGVGPKLAQRIVLELKDKVAKGLAEGVTLGDVGGSSAAPAGNMTQAIAALTSLGYSPSEAAAAVAKTDETLPVEEIIKLALRSMAKGR